MKRSIKKMLKLEILGRYTFNAVPHTAFKLHIINMLWTSLFRRIPGHEPIWN